jgi:cytochrome P450
MQVALSINHVMFGDSILSTLGMIPFVHLTSDLQITKGERHRKQRKMLNPAFAPSHLRHIGKHILLPTKLLISINLSIVPIFHDVTRKVWCFYRTKDSDDI